MVLNWGWPWKYQTFLWSVVILGAGGGQMKLTKFRESLILWKILSFLRVCLLSVEWCYWCVHPCYSPDRIGASPTFVREATINYQHIYNTVNYQQTQCLTHKHTYEYIQHMLHVCSNSLAPILIQHNFLNHVHIVCQKNQPLWMA